MPGNYDGGGMEREMIYRLYLIPVRHFPNRTGGMSLPLRTVDLTSLQRHTANPREVTSFIANWYQSKVL